MIWFAKAFSWLHINFVCRQSFYLVNSSKFDPNMNIYVNITNRNICVFPAQPIIVIHIILHILYLLAKNWRSAPILASSCGGPAVACTQGLASLASQGTHARARFTCYPREENKGSLHSVLFVVYIFLLLTICYKQMLALLISWTLGWFHIELPYALLKDHWVHNHGFKSRPGKICPPPHILKPNKEWNIIIFYHISWLEINLMIILIILKLYY